MILQQISKLKIKSELFTKKYNFYTQIIFYYILQNYLKTFNKPPNSNPYLHKKKFFYIFALHLPSSYRHNLLSPD